MRITANQVTLARIFLLPVPVYLLIYGASFQWWIAFALLVILGATDFVDGWMARIEGPTKLGSLIDPVADKIFVAAIVLSMLAIDLYPGWMIGILLCREFLMTSLRSSVAIRKEAIKTSRLAKLKTIVQMGGCGTIFLTIVLPKQALIYACLSLALPFILVWLCYLIKRKTPPFWALPVGLCFLLVVVLISLFVVKTSLIVQMSIILAITWASAVEYIVGSYKLLKRSGVWLGDWLRLSWTLMYGLLVPVLVGYFPIIVLPVLVSMALEFGIGGIDNIVVVEKNHFVIGPFIASLGAGIVFVGLMLLAMNGILAVPVLYIAIALAISSFIVAATFFAKYFDIFRRTIV